MKIWKRVAPTTVTKVGWRTVVTKTFVDSVGKKHTFETYDKEGRECVTILPITTDKRVVIARQFRVGPEKINEDLPGGFVEAGEDLETAGRREMREETGYEAGELEYLGAYHKDGYMNATWHYYLATGCIRRKNANYQESAEEVEVDLISIEQLFENARYDKMTDPVAVYWAQDKLKKIQENA